MRGRLPLLFTAMVVLVACTGGVDIKTNGSPSAQGPVGPTWQADWPQYLFDRQHTSMNAAATTITPANVQNLAPAWSFDAPGPTETGQPAAQFFASPVVVDGVAYIGANTGDFFALSATDGTVRWSRNLGWVPNRTCGGRGITSTASVIDGTVYVGGGDGKLYALNADTGDVVWSAPIVNPGKKQNEAYLWGSPLVANGEVYIGMSSQCDNPLIRGGIKAVNAQTGHVDATYYTVPPKDIGGSVWSSLAADANDHVYASTGNPDVNQKEGPAWGDSFGLVSFAPPLRRKGAWQVPIDSVKVRDWDFGASPSIWNLKSTTYFGACNKDGVFYAVDAATDRLAWSTPISEAYPSSNCLSGSVFDKRSGRLYIASGQWRKAKGTVVAMDAATGKIIWRLKLPAPAIGSLSLDGGGVIAVPEYGSQSVVFVDARKGERLGEVNANHEDVFSQPVFSDSYLYVATVPGHLYAFKVGS
ncbi:MAG: PQQ-binding-like beta-propeller repeat protein [Planctomycetaceae bacterium]